MDSTASGTALDTGGIVNKYLLNEDGMQVGWFPLQPKLSLSVRLWDVDRGLLWGVVRRQENTVSILTSLTPTLPGSGSEVTERDSPVWTQASGGHIQVLPP